MKKVLMFAMVVACGPANSSETVDALNGSNGSGSNQGSNQGSNTPVTEDVTCQSFTFTDTDSTGAKTVSTYRWAVVASVTEGSSFAVEQCDGTERLTNAQGVVTTIPLNGAYAPTCPTGHTCNTTGNPYPSIAHACSWVTIGTFWDGKLYVNCGETITEYNAQNQITNATDINYGSIKVQH